MLIRGWASLYGVKDRAGDVVMPGAFTRTLTAGHPIGMLLAHYQGSVIGRWDTVEERTEGLWVEGEIIKGVREGEEAAILIRTGALRCLSIGYTAIDVMTTEAGRELLAVDLSEVSLVVSGACPGCLILKEEPHAETRNAAFPDHAHSLHRAGF